MSIRLLPLVAIFAATLGVALLTGHGAADQSISTVHHRLPKLPSYSFRDVVEHSSIQPQAVLGSDDRTQITSTDEFPWSSIAWLALYDSSNQVTGTCSGTLVGPDTVLTAAHCLYEGSTGWIGNVVVVPGENSGVEPFGYEFGLDYWVPPAWILSGGADGLYDYGLIQLPDSAMGNSAGWMPVADMLTSTLQRVDFMPSIVGYPGDKSLGTMWGQSVQSFAEVMPSTYTYDIDTFPGQSGSAVFSANTNEWFLGHVVGVHDGYNGLHNYGSRIDDVLLGDIESACSLVGCTIESYVEGAFPTPSPTPIHSLTPTPSPSATAVPSQTLAPQGLQQGDANCSGVIDAGDIAALIKRAIGLVVSAICDTYQDDVNCLNGTDAIDALDVAVFLAEGNPLPVAGGCPPIGQYFGTGGSSATPTHSPTPTPTHTPTPTPTHTPASSPTPTPTSGSGDAPLTSGFVLMMPFLFLGDPNYTCVFLNGVIGCADGLSPDYGGAAVSASQLYWDAQNTVPDYLCTIGSTSFQCETSDNGYPDYDCAPGSGIFYCTSSSASWPDYGCSFPDATSAVCATLDVSFPNFVCGVAGTVLNGAMVCETY
jgi:V8-like Glu-specific endopeptidase